METATINKLKTKDKRVPRFWSKVSLFWRGVLWDYKKAI